MPKHSKRDGAILRAFRPTFGVAIGTALALVAIVAGVIVAVTYPPLSGYVFAVATGMGIGVVALAVTVPIAVLFRGRLPSSADDWVLW